MDDSRRTFVITCMIMQPCSHTHTRTHVDTLVIRPSRWPEVLSQPVLPDSHEINASSSQYIYVCAHALNTESALCNSSVLESCVYEITSMKLLSVLFCCVLCILLSKAIWYKAHKRTARLHSSNNSHYYSSSIRHKNPAQLHNAISLIQSWHQRFKSLLLLF